MPYIERPLFSIWRYAEYELHEKSAASFNLLSETLSMGGLPSARSNKLLASLSDDCWRQVEPCLSSFETPAGTVLYRQGELVQFLYFPVSGVVARFLMNEEAQSTEFSVCGNEGAIGMMAVFGAPAMGSAMALCDSCHYRCSAGKVAELMDGREFRAVVLRYTRYMISEIIQNSLCNKHHSTEQRFSRWLLMCLDRSHTLDLEITHDVVARLLGVRREGVSEVTGRLRAQGIIDVRRRHIVLVNRMALIARSCDCYRTMVEKYRQLLPDPKVDDRAVG